MEGMPRFPMLAPEPLCPVNEYDDDFKLQIKQYILTHFQADPHQFDTALRELEQLKRDACKVHVDVEAACQLKRYFAQLLMMKNRFPMEKDDEIKVLYSWAERSGESTTCHTQADIGYEMACVMYQIGAIHAGIAANETRVDESSIKNAFMHFQYAAYPLQYLRDKMAANYNVAHFDKGFLTFFINILLAQAQECLVEKSLIDHRTSFVIAKLAVYLSDIYSKCYDFAYDSSTLSELLPTKQFHLLIRNCLIKSGIYGCIAMLHMGMKAEEEQKFGERLGYYEAADTHLQSALKVCKEEKRDGMVDTVRFMIDVCKAKLDNAKKENDFIYHERVPKREELVGKIEGLQKVNPLSFDPLDPSVGGEDIFAALVPPTVLSSVSQYEEEKARLKREVLARVNEKDEKLERYLSALNFKDLGLYGDGKDCEVIVPDMLMERNAELYMKKDAVPVLLRELQAVDDLAKKSDILLDDLGKRLQTIDLPELTVDEGYQAICKEVERLVNHNTVARNNNSELRKALAAHSANLQRLSVHVSELSETLRGDTVDPATTPQGQALLKVVAKAEEMQKQRAMLVARFSEELQSDDINKKLLTERSLDEKSVFVEELKKHDQTIKFIDANLAAQDNIISHITEANADFAEQRKVLLENNDWRNNQIMALLTAYDIYADVCAKVDDGKKFYEKLIDRLSKLGIAVEGIESAYKVEKTRIEREKRALEEKMASLKAAREARESMQDFGAALPAISGAGVPGGYPAGTARAGRPRLGDYLEFYRNKQNRGGPSGGIAQPVSMAQIPVPQPPSPAPSSVFEFGPQDAPSPQPFNPSPIPQGFHPSTQHYAPPQQQYQTPVPQQQYLPVNMAVQPAASQMPSSHRNEKPQGYGYIVPSSSSQPRASDNHQFQPLPGPAPIVSQEQTSAPQQHYFHPTQHMPSSTPMPFQAPPQAVYSQQNFAPPGGQIPSGQTQASNFSFSAVSQQPRAQYSHSEFKPQSGSLEPTHTFISNGPTERAAQPIFQPVVPEPRPSAQFFAPASTQLMTSSLPSQISHQSTVENASFSTIQYLPTAPGNTSLPMPQKSSANISSSSGQSQFSGAMNPTTQVPNVVNQVSTPSGACINGQQASQAQPKQNLEAPSSIVASVGQTPLFSGYSQVPNAVHSNMESKPVVEGTNATATSSNQKPQSASGQLPGNWHNGFGGQPMQQSPWHQNAVAPSPWHRPVSSFSQAPAPPNLQPQNQDVTSSGFSANFSAPNFVKAQAAQSVQPPPPNHNATSLPVPQTKPSGPVDLLGDLLGDLSLPPPLQPSAALNPVPVSAPPPQTEKQNLQRSAAGSDRPVTQKPTTQVAATVRNEAENIRPAAAVIPIPHRAPSPVVEQPILSMNKPSSISVFPQVAPSQTTQVSHSTPEPTPVTSVLSPTSFTLGEGDTTKLAKRQLHTAVRSGGQLPELDPNDPLNQLDAFWKAR